MDKEGQEIGGSESDDRKRRSPPDIAGGNLPAGDIDVVPAVLGLVAGFVDSCTFLAFNGLFVAQLTGSFVTIGSEFAGNHQTFLITALAIPTFFFAAVLATVIIRVAIEGPRAWVAPRALEASLLAGLVLVGISPHDAVLSPSAAVLFGLAAMGVQSCCPSTASRPT
jgi:uncharacterized membrane protein YoaK (UPF0700 family)